MTSCHRQKECETSRYRHGCDPPKLIQAGPSPVAKNQRPTPPVSKQSLIRLIELQPSLLDSLFRFHSKQRKYELPAATLTTTLTELNRLYGVYSEVMNKKTPNSQEADRAWTDYEAYVKRYKKERSMEQE